MKLHGPSVKRTLYVVAVSVVFAAACGIPLDDSPELIANDDLPQALQPAETSTTTTIPDRLAEELVIFLVSPGDGTVNLMPVTRQVPDVVDIDLERAAVEQLVAGPSAEEQLEDNLTTFVVPSGDAPIQVLDVRRPDENQLVVVLSEPPTLEGSDRTTAFAQLVFTITENNTQSSVRFMVRSAEGVDDFIAVKTDTEEGDVTRPVNRDDFTSLAPLRGPS